MTLRRKTLLIIFLTLTGLITILYFASKSIVLKSFTELEEHHVKEDTERFLHALSSEILSLAVTAGDWAGSDDTCRFIEDGNEDYILRNLIEPNWVQLKLNLIVFIHSSGRIVYGKSFDLEKEELAPLSEDIESLLSIESPLLRRTEDGAKGVVVLPGGPMLVASQPILSSEYRGPLRGTLIMGRRLDSKMIQHLSQITKQSIVLEKLSGSGERLPADFETVRPSLSKDKPIAVRSLNESTIAGYALICDIFGKAALAARVATPKVISAQGQKTVHYFILSLLGAGAVFGVVVLLLLEKAVLSRLARITSEVGGIGASNDISKRVSAQGSDELSALSRSINGMLTALHRSQQELRESEQRLRTLIEAMPDAVCLKDGQGRWLEGNGYLLGLLNIPDVVYKGRTSSEIAQVSETYRAIVSECLASDERTWETGANTRNEHLIPMPDGSKRTYDVIRVPLYCEKGERKGIISIARDITERRRIREALRKSEEKFRNLVETTTDWVWEVDENFVYTYVNPRVEDILGDSPQEVIDRTPFDFMPPDEIRRVSGIVEPLVAERKPFSFLENVVLHKDRRRVVLETSGVPVIDGSGTFKGYRGINRDITRRREAEKALREGESFLAGIFKSIQDGLSILDLDLNIVRVNPTMEQWFAHSAPLVGKKCFEAYHGRLEACETCPVCYTIATGKTAHEVVPRRGPDGRVEGWFDLFSFPLRDSDSERIKGVIEYVHDITDRRKTEEVREKLISELQLALAEVKTLSGMLPICSACKKIRDDKGYWNQIEGYIQRNSNVQFSHGICPDCARRLYPDLFEDNGG